MALGAVLIIRAKKETQSQVDGGGLIEPSALDQTKLMAGALQSADICGRSTVERLAERFLAIDADCISVLVEDGAQLPIFRSNHSRLTVEVVGDVRAAIAPKIKEFANLGIDHAFVTRADTYTETDLIDLLSFHRASRQDVTPTFCKEGGLSLWVVDCAAAQESTLAGLLNDGAHGSRYFIREYVNSLNHPRDLRRFAADMLRGTCEARPSGHQTRPGVWVDEGAEIHRRARIVAPAYIGCESKLRADALITRLSNIERECCIDCGTVIEDSSILPNTTVGICLDLCHAVVSGNQLMNLERDVLIDIADAAVLRSTDPQHAPFVAAKLSPVPLDVNHKVTKMHPMSEAWQLDGNLIQE